jgi:hypothetical protein
VAHRETGLEKGPRCCHLLRLDANLPLVRLLSQGCLRVAHRIRETGLEMGPRCCHLLRLDANLPFVRLLSRRRRRRRASCHAALRASNTSLRTPRRLLLDRTRSIRAPCLREPRRVAPWPCSDTPDCSAAPYTSLVTAEGRSADRWAAVLTARDSEGG